MATSARPDSPNSNGTPPSSSSSDDATLPPPDATAQLSYSGTPRMPDGRTAPDEYSQDLREPTKRMQVLEEMGNDETVRAAIDARRQEVNSANWTLASEDKTPLGQEILEFVEDNIYPLIDPLIRWLAGGAFQYGFGCVEPVYQWSDRPPVSSISRGKIVRPTSKSGERRIYLAKLAHLRQRSIETFNISDTGDLNEVWQYVYNGNRFARVQIPGDKLLLWTYNQQGDDRWGYPPTRAIYKAYTFKQQLEKINLMHFDRFGVGIPVAEAGPTWTTNEYKTLGKYLELYRSGASGYVVHPNGGKISILSSDGKTPESALEWVQAYNLSIAKAFLTQQSELANGTHGSKALADTFYTQMEGIVQADCEELANLINNRLIILLVLWNFGEQSVYPQFAPSQRVKAGAGVGTIVQQLIASGSLHPRPEDEAFFRDILGMPAVAIETLQAEQQTRDVQAKAAAQAQADALKQGASQNADGKHGVVGKIGAKPAPAADPPAKIAASVTRALSAMPVGTPDPAVRGTSTYRTDAYALWEYTILRPDVLSRDLDLQTTRAAGEVQDVLHTIDAELAQQVTAFAAKGTAALASAVKSIAVPDTLRAQLTAVLTAVATRARTYGAHAVHNEVQRQLAPQGVGPQRTPNNYPSNYTALSTSTDDPTSASADDEKSADDHRLSAEVESTVEDEIARREQAARNAALTALAQAAEQTADTLATVVETAVKSALVGLSTGRTQQNVQGVVNVGFGIGRTDEADAIHEAAQVALAAPSRTPKLLPAGTTPDEPASGGAGSGGNKSGLRDSNGQPVDLRSKVYSAVMDGGTCDPCAMWDGAEFPIDYPEDFTGVQAPNPRCEGTYAACRCVWIYITDKEQAPLVPAAKGPLPIRGSR